MLEVVLVGEGLANGTSIILSAFQEAHTKVKRREIQRNLIRKKPLLLGPEDPCLKCSCLGNGCEDPCEKILSFMETHPKLGDKYQTI